MELVDRKHAAVFAEKPIVPGKSVVTVTGKILDAEDMRYLVDFRLDIWLTAEHFAYEIEVDFSKVMGVRYTLLVNSGSSANLIALTALTSPTLGDRQLNLGNEVSIVTFGIPFTLTSIIQYGYTN